MYININIVIRRFANIFLNWRINKIGFKLNSQHQSQIKWCYSKFTVHAGDIQKLILYSFLFAFMFESSLNGLLCKSIEKTDNNRQISTKHNYQYLLVMLVIHLRCWMLIYEILHYISTDFRNLQKNMYILKDEIYPFLNLSSTKIEF